MSAARAAAAVVLLLAGCATPPGPREAKRREFDRLQRRGENVFSPAVPDALRLAVRRYQDREKLANGLEYGASVRGLRLRGAAAESVAAALAERRCERRDELLRDPKTGEAKLCGGRTVAQWLWECRDGGLVRLKPHGDPCNRFRPQPHGSKSVRDPFDADPLDFDGEAFKVDEDGNPVPKSPATLRPGLDPDAWGEDAHADLGV